MSDNFLSSRNKLGLVPKETMNNFMKVRKRLGMKKVKGRICEVQVNEFIERSKPHKIYPLSNIKTIIKGNRKQ